MYLIILYSVLLDDLGVTETVVLFDSSVILDCLDWRSQGVARVKLLTSPLPWDSSRRRLCIASPRPASLFIPHVLCVMIHARISLYNHHSPSITYKNQIRRTTLERAVFRSSSSAFFSSSTDSTTSKRYGTTAISRR